MQKYFKGLNDGQAEAVKTVHGVVRVNAIAGSGKTRVLVNRTGYMIEEIGIDPENMMLTTFTKKATDEMKKRLKEIISFNDLNALTLGTSHSIGRKIIAKEFKELNHPLASFARNDGLLMNSRLKFFCEDIKKSIFNDSSLTTATRTTAQKANVKMFLAFVSTNKNNDIDYIECEEQNAMTASDAQWAYIEFYKRYEIKKFAEKKIDFDDMLFLAVRLLSGRDKYVKVKQSDAILKSWQEKFTHILVDEAQDNNKLQYQMVQMLAYPHNNILFVGDDDQSMYKFRGASPEDFIDLKACYPNMYEIPMELNYRSNPRILEVSNNLIKNNNKRIVKVMKSGRKDLESDMSAVRFDVFESEGEESRERVEEIKILNEQEGIEYRDIAFLYRTNAQSQSIEHSLIMSGIPYVIHGSISFYDRKEVKDITAYLKLMLDMTDNKSFDRVFNVPSRFLGKAFLEKISSFKGSRFIACDKVVLKQYEKDGMRKFKNLVQEMQQLNEKGKDLTDIVNYLLEEGGYSDYLKGDIDESEGEEEQNEIVNTLMHLLTHFENAREFVEYIETMTSKKKVGEEEDGLNAVQLMTIHRSKGLEFKIVMGMGINEGVLPHNKSVEKEALGDMSAIEEERRLAYVLATRAEIGLYLSSTEYYNGKYAEVSRFVWEMGLVEHVTEEVEEEYNLSQEEALEA